jgi:hypothetical protein
LAESQHEPDGGMNATATQTGSRETLSGITRSTDEQVAIEGKPSFTRTRLSTRILGTLGVAVVAVLFHFSVAHFLGLNKESARPPAGAGAMVLFWYLYGQRPRTTILKAFSLTVACTAAAYVAAALTYRLTDALALTLVITLSCVGAILLLSFGSLAELRRKREQPLPASTLDGALLLLGAATLVVFFAGADEIGGLHRQVPDQATTQAGPTNLENGNPAQKSPSRILQLPGYPPVSVPYNMSDDQAAQFIRAQIPPLSDKPSQAYKKPAATTEAKPEP